MVAMSCALMYAASFAFTTSAKSPADRTPFTGNLSYYGSSDNAVLSVIDADVPKFTSEYPRHSVDWCIERAQWYWKIYQETPETGADKSPPETVWSIFDANIDPCPMLNQDTADWLSTLDEQNPHEIDDDSTAFDVRYPKDPKAVPDKHRAEYRGMAAPADKILIIQNMDKGQGQGVIPKPWRLSNIAWWMWTEALQRHMWQDESDDWTKHRKDLRYWYQENVNNEDTKKILDIATMGQRSNKVHVMDWLPLGPENDGFWAILGTDNGIGVLHLLRENKEALGVKEIEDIEINVLPTLEKDGTVLWSLMVDLKSDQRGPDVEN